MSQSTSSVAGAAGNTGVGSGAANPLASLTGNFQTFLTLLTTQLPMDSNQFTTELVQFAGVEQQISTNSSLAQLIQLAQGSAVVQSAQLLGRQVDVASGKLVLQNGSATIDFTAPSAGPVTVAVLGAAGQPLYQATVNAAQGSNTWSWRGQTANGTTMPDGAYTVSVTTAGDGSATALPFSVRGTVTGVQQNGNSVDLQLGPLSVGVQALTSVQN
jgi:flagellar basal-body rod modification protein FlgD